MTGTPWYHLMSNPSYTYEFNFIGPQVEEREKLIEDGNRDVYTTKMVNGKEKDFLIEDMKATRLEQSDMVMILLNLAYIPDSVVHQINFGVPGWSKTFKTAMQAYKDEWSAKHNAVWKW